MTRALGRGELIAGVAARDLRAVLRKLGDSVFGFGLFAAIAAKLTPDPIGLAEALANDGYLERIPETLHGAVMVSQGVIVGDHAEGLWRVTPRGGEVGQAIARPRIHRATVDRLVGGLLQRVATVNTARRFLYRVSRVLVFGSYPAASAGYDAAGRFSQYLVLGQHQRSDELMGSAAAAVKGEARVAEVRRTERVLVVRLEGAVDTTHALRRAEWEAKVRAARTPTINVTVQGWTQADGSRCCGCGR